VQALVWKIVEGKLVLGCSKTSEKVSQQLKPMLLQGQIHSPGQVCKVGASPGHPLLSREMDLYGMINNLD
jgi:hypothetical protein